MQNKKRLLIILALLLLVRFVIQPLYQWQQQSWSELQLFAKREARGQQLLSQQQAVNTAVANWQSLAAQANSWYPTFTDASSAQLSSQQAIQQWVVTTGAQFELFDWLQLGPLATAKLERATVKLRVKGTAAALAALHAELASQPNITVMNTQFNWQNQLGLHTDITANFDLLFYYQQALQE